jgi:hypothetical protein
MPGVIASFPFLHLCPVKWECYSLNSGFAFPVFA